LIEINRNLILLLRLMNPAKTMEIRGNEDEGKILPRAGNEDEDEEYFRLWRSIWIDIFVLIQ
jgi:hypothetical protein